MFVAGEGPSDAPLMLIGEYVGKEEMRINELKQGTGTGRNFIGYTGMELDAYLKHVEIAREECYITNWIKERELFDEKVPEEEYQHWLPLLLAEIRSVKPKVVVTFGAKITEQLTGRKISDVNGRHLRVDFEGRQISVVPIYNPAYAFKKTAVIVDIRRAFDTLRRVIDGKEEEFVERPLEGVYEDAKDRGPLFRAFRDTEVGLFALDTETTDGDVLFSASVSWREGTALFIERTDEEAMEVLKRRLAGKAVVVMHNAVFDYKVLLKAGIVPPAKIYDTMVMAFLLGERRVGLKVLAADILGLGMTEYDELVEEHGIEPALEYLEKVMEMEWPQMSPIKKIVDGKMKLRRPTDVGDRAERIFFDTIEKDADPRERWKRIKQNEGRGVVEKKIGKMPSPDVRSVPKDLLVRYACGDADATLRLHHILFPRVQAASLLSVLEMDMRVAPMLSEMELRGVLADPDYVDSEVRVAVSTEVARQEVAIFAAAEKLVNPASWKQVLAEMQRFGIHEESTNKKIMAKYKDNAFVLGVLEWRKNSKLLGTYVDNFWQFVDADGAVRTRFSMTTTETGRLASYEPNLMNQPKKTEIGRKIRSAYVAREGFLFLSTDYSQIETRVAAHLSRDAELLRLFLENRDVHTETAARMFGLKVEDVDPIKHRYPAKKVTYAILYGISAKGLYEVFLVEGITAFSVQDCQKMINAWFAIYSGVEDWIHEVERFVRLEGYVRDLFGRRRFVYAAQSPTKWIRAEALRQAVNMPVQATAQGIIKTAMGELRTRPWYGVDCFPLLQIHDELLWEVKEDKLDVVKDDVLDVMRNAVRLKVPVEVDWKAGKRWGELN